MYTVSVFELHQLIYVICLLDKLGLWPQPFFGTYVGASVGTSVGASADLLSGKSKGNEFQYKCIATILASS